MKDKIKLIVKLSIATLASVAVGTLLANSLVSADSTTSSSTTGSTSSATSTKASTANQQARLQNIISKGNQEIERRLTTLGTLSSKINAATHLNQSDKTSLSNEVSSTVSGLNSLKTQLDAETTVAAARTDVQNIYNEYRVYALVAPKVGLIKVADDQQVVQAKLQTLSQKLQARITAQQQAGKNVSSMQSELSDMNSKIAAAQAISNNIENGVINLQPTDYNSNHGVLSGDNSQLKTARSDDQASYQDAKNIVASLKGNK